MDALPGVGEEQRLVLLVPAHPVVLVLRKPEDLGDRAAPRRRSLAPVNLDQVPDLPINGLVSLMLWSSLALSRVGGCG